jgi:hypothetical protein
VAGTADILELNGMHRILTVSRSNLTGLVIGEKRWPIWACGAFRERAGERVRARKQKARLLLAKQGPVAV